MAECRISGRPLELKPQRLVQRSVMADGKALQFPQVLAVTQNSSVSASGVTQLEQSRPSRG